MIDTIIIKNWLKQIEEELALKPQEIQEEVERLKGLISETIKEGDDALYLPYSLETEFAEKLRENGFKVEVTKWKAKSDIDIDTGFTEITGW